ncbi:hypothetical protein ACF1GY_34730 [Streptomyces sp. NPDC014684]|uniref:hypothetical protein n=1 Tax=unclassified Streptomyces TaxID=2593676 RepID=UPI0033EF3B7E
MARSLAAGRIPAGGQLRGRGDYGQCGDDQSEAEDAQEYLPGVGVTIRPTWWLKRAEAAMAATAAVAAKTASSACHQVPLEVMTASRGR